MDTQTQRPLVQVKYYLVQVSVEVELVQVSVEVELVQVSVEVELVQVKYYLVASVEVEMVRTRAEFTQHRIRARETIESV